MENMLRKLEQNVKTKGATEANLREFWKLVNRAKLEKQISEETLNRIVTLRDTLFNELYPPFFSLRQGLGLTAVATFVGAVLIWYALQLDQLLFFLIGSVFLMVGTHPWGHWIAGKFVRVNYEYFYLDGPAKFELSLKINYPNYLKASFNSRMTVHASGALTTILTSLMLLFVSLTTHSIWIRFMSVVIFIVIMVTEIISWSGITSGDLKRARKERSLKRRCKRRRTLNTASVIASLLL